MKATELIGYTRRLLKNRRMRVLLFCMLPLGAEIFFRASEAALFSLMLYFGSIEPLGLFLGMYPEQTAVSGIFEILRILVVPPLWCGLAARLTMLAEGKDEPRELSDIFLSGRFIRRSIAASLTVRVIAGAALIPAVMLVSHGIWMLGDGADSRELIISTNLIALGIAFVFLWAAVRLGASAVPFILWKFPELSPVGAVFASFRFMRGRRGFPLMLMLAYLPPALTIIAAPWALPEWAAAYAVGISIFFKEDESENERAHIQGRNRSGAVPQRLSQGKLRRIGRTAAKAEKQ